ncbi:MAG: HD domain-containing protein [Actinobacteria bacterium]|nr:HD domain-containing protein [Actinomycetota bacterium]MCI0543290.1 HD domain-containing protein [Actinomycetota bacterium]MCI0679020.1 HD domain-containing protein [Actinomycetota bacterium]
MLRRAREERERLEHELLAPEATKADRSAGRAEPEDPDELRTAFERDRDRVIHSKAFRRLKHKTQVFLNPDGDHFVTRMTHTIHVNQVGRALARALGLNEDLTEAICLAHDVGHSPFGHTGEEALSPLVDGEWLHSAHGVRTLSLLEPLNLSHEVLDGVRAHSWRVDPPPETPEGWLCRFADRIAYLTHDVSDALRAGVIEYHDLPVAALTTFGATAREWIGSMVNAVIDASHETGVVSMRGEHLEVMGTLRSFMFERVYLRPESEAQKDKAILVIQDLVRYYLEHPDEVPDSYTVPGAPPLTRAIDYVAGMTDRYALRAHDRLYRPTLLD